jgi:hypothetical protein
MALQTSGTISMSQVRSTHTGGGNTNNNAKKYYRDPANNTSVSPFVQNQTGSPPTYTTVSGYHPGTPGYCSRTCYGNCSKKCSKNPPIQLPSGFYAGGGYTCGSGQSPSHSQYGGVFYCNPANGQPAKPGGSYSYTTMHPGNVSPANQGVPTSGRIKWTDWYGSSRG